MTARLGAFALVLASAAPASAHPGVRVVDSTSYCLTGRMADGSYTRPRSAASNSHRLGTKITLTRPGPGGLRRYVIRDRIGWGSSLDLWTGSCGAAIRYGRRTAAYRLGWHK